MKRAAGGQGKKKAPPEIHSITIGEHHHFGVPVEKRRGGGGDGLKQIQTTAKGESFFKKKEDTTCDKRRRSGEGGETPCGAEAPTAPMERLSSARKGQQE